MLPRCSCFQVVVFLLNLAFVTCDPTVAVVDFQTQGSTVYQGRVSYATGENGTNWNAGPILSCTANSCPEWIVEGWATNERKNGDPVAVGEEVKFRLNATLNVKSKIRLGLCGSKCSVVTSWGISRGTQNQAPILGNVRWISRNGDINDNLYSTDLSSYAGPWTFDDEPFHTFVVQRRSEHEMVVWAEIGGQRTAELVLPLTADRDKFFVSSFVGPTNFISESGKAAQVWTYKPTLGARSGVLLSPTLAGTPRISNKQWLCVEVAHRSFGVLLLGSMDANGVWRALASLQSDKQGEDVAWTRNRVLVHVPSSSWRLSVSTSTKSFIESIASCSLGLNDAVEMGHVSHNISGGVPHVSGKISTATWENDVYECENGVRKINEDGTCICHHGFTGPNCEEACTVGFVGKNCDVPCAGDSCRHVIVCSKGLCGCASGYKGNLCQFGCTPGEYGADCTKSCGACEGGAAFCDKSTGFCPSGCLTGYLGKNCKQEFIHLNQPPEIVTQDFREGKTIVTGTVNISRNTTTGNGVPAILEVQFKVLSPASTQVTWRSGDVVGLSADYANKTNVIPWRLESIPLFSSRIAIRGILKDASLQGFDNDAIPQVIANLDAAVESLQAARINPWTQNISWSYAYNTEQHVSYRCVGLLACDAPCKQSAGRVSASGNHAVLRGLIPGGRYIVTLSNSSDTAENVLATETFTTAFAAPSTVPELARLLWVRDSEAAVVWREPAHSCLLDNGPRAGFHWELSDGQRGNSSVPRVTLKGLRAGTSYEFSVFARGVAGWQLNPPRGPLRMTFTTLPSAVQQ